MARAGQMLSVERLAPLHWVSKAPDSRYEQGSRWVVSSVHNAYVGRTLAGAFIGWLRMVR